MPANNTSLCHIHKPEFLSTSPLCRPRSFTARWAKEQDSSINIYIIANTLKQVMKLLKLRYTRPAISVLPPVVTTSLEVSSSWCYHDGVWKERVDWGKSNKSPREYGGLSQWYRSQNHSQMSYLVSHSFLHLGLPPSGIWPTTWFPARDENVVMWEIINA